MEKTTKSAPQLSFWHTEWKLLRPALGNISFLLCFLLSSTIGIAQTIFSNPITGTNPSNSNPYTTGQTVAANITASGIGRGNGVSAASANDRYSVSGFSTSSTFSASNNEYFEFTITPNSNYQISFSSFAYTGQASGSGPISFLFRSSADNYTANIGTANATGTTISLSAAAYQNRTTAITFRLYGYDSSGSTGTYSVNDFIFSGTVCLRPSISAQPTASQSLCVGSALNLSVTAANATSYQWKKGGVSIPSANSNTYSIATVATTDAGTYTVDVINSCQTITSNSAVVAVSAQPTAGGGGSTTTCSNQPVVISGMSASNGTISWVENGAGSITSGGSTLAPTYTPAAADGGNVVTLTMTVSNSPCVAATAMYTINVTAAPTANAGTAVLICETETDVNVTAGASATNQVSLAWSSSGSGTFDNADSINLATYTPSASDIAAGSVTITLTATGNAPCSNAVSNKTFTIRKTPTASAGGSTTICSNQTAQVSGASATNGTISWTENGAGSITAGATSLTPTYTAAAGDGGNMVTLTMTVSNSPCPAATATYTINVTAAPSANAGTAVATCANSGPVNVTAGASASNNSSVNWTSSGSGSFADATSLTLAIYTPSAADISAGSVTLTLTATGNSPCANATSMKLLTIKAIPMVSGVTICQGEPSQALQSSTVCPVSTAVQSTPHISGTAVNSTGIGTVAWSNPGNITTAGSPYATVATSFSISNYLFATNYGFAIPAGSVIGGIDVDINHQGSSVQFGSGVSDSRLSLIKGGTVTSTNRSSSTNWPTTMGVASYGSSSDLWGSTWTVADINASNFGVALATTSILNRTATVDYIQVTVTYSPPGDLNWYTVSSGGSVIGTGSSFDPVGVAGSGLADTNTPGTTTYYVECSTTAGCRAPVDYLINSLPTVSFTGLSTSYCADAASVLLTGNQAPAGTFSGAGITNNGNGTANFSSVAAGVGPHQITYSYTDGNTCVNTSMQTVTVVANTTYYADTDNDGFGNIAVIQLSCTGAPSGYVLDNTDCDDTNGAIHETFPFYVDADGDTYGTGSLVSACAVDANTPPAGYSLNNSDCDDTNAAIHQTYMFYADADGDTYGAGSLVSACAVNATTPPAGYSLNNTDCDDNNSAVYQTGSLYVDFDSDGYSSGATQVVCYGATVPVGYVANATAIDCNDSIAAINPGHVEVLYNGVDDNCDGNLDEGFQIKTSLLPASCGTTLASIGSLIGITTLAPGAAYTGWRIRLTNGAQVQIIEKSVPHFTLPEFPSYAYATTYTVEIELQRNGVWLGYYGPACLVSSPAVLEEGGATSVTPSQCGITLAKINTLIATTSLQGVTGYRFQITNLTDPLGPLAVQVIDRTQNWFSLPMLARYNYGTTYRIEIAVKTTGAYSGFGSPCEVNSPAAPSLINCGGTAASGTTTVAATSVQGANQYRFQITRASDLASATIDRSTNYFIFNAVPASAFTAGGLYYIRVAVMTTGIWSPYGDACEYTAPGGSSRAEDADASILHSEFRATAYPNPFSTDFGLDLTSTSQANAEVRVYDMLGKLIELKSAAMQDWSFEKLGVKYPSGVYNVVITHAGFVKTIRVIKR